MESKYQIILGAEESFARVVALGVQVTRPSSVWHYLIPGIFIFDFLKRNAEIRKYSFHFLFPRKSALTTARGILRGEPREDALSRAEREIRSWLESLHLVSESIVRSQTAAVELLVEHYHRLLAAKGETFEDLMVDAYGIRETYEAFLSRLVAAEEAVDNALKERFRDNEKVRDRLEAEKSQLKEQRRKQTNRIF
ncbi:MAG: NF038143 family protein [Desulfatiglandales bacterium]